MIRTLKFLFWILVLFAVVFGAYSWRVEQEYQSALEITASDDSSRRVRITISDGQTVGSIADLLVQEQIITRPDVFLKYLKREGYDTKIGSGNFLLFPSETIPDIARTLARERETEIRLTFPEGYTVKKMNDVLKEKNLITGNEFLDCLENCSFPFPFLENVQSLEGFLFPSTYYVYASNFTPENFISRLTGTFEQQIAPYRADIPSDKLYDIVIMASLIEREALTDEERPIIAGILWKRLKNNWYLGVDATTRYYKNDWIGALTYEDFADDNPYNTRKNLGLPPTPIANPGIKSLRAAIYPTETEYWYYLHDSNRTIHYARTLDEHNRNRVKYLY